MLNQNELKNILFFLSNGRWGLNVQESNELVSLTKKIGELITVEEVKPEDNNGTN